MQLTIGIVGLPNVGKSTLFSAITKKQVPAENYPFCTIDPNVGVVAVPDDRLNQLALLSHSAKSIPAAIEFVDIAGLVQGAHKGEGLGNQFLSHVRETDALVHILRSFHDSNVIHVAGEPDWKRDKEIIETELILADLAVIEKRLDALAKKKRIGDAEAQAEYDLLSYCKQTLETEKPLRESSFSPEDERVLKPYNFLTKKPVLYILNRDEKEKENIPSDLADAISLCIRWESEIAALSPDELRELGIEKTGLDSLISAAYRLLNLITFFTTGEKETRAWTIARGTQAPQAAGVIHSDFEKGFIRAETITWDALLAAGSWNRAREQGIIRMEGKEYCVQDGDVILFHHSS